MPARTLPIFTAEEIKQHTSAKSCYVLRGPKVYDVTSFVDDHPGGGDLILDYAGKDVDEIMGDIVSHHHSEAAYEILDECLVGFLEESQANGSKGLPNGSGSKLTKPVYKSTGLSSEEDLSVETDIASDYKTHKFLDLSKPLLMQLWNGGFSKEFYLDQVHRPRHYMGGDSAPLFGNFLEPLSKTAWWVVPTLWLPCVAYGTFLGMSGIAVGTGALYWIGGLFLWSLIEYGMHRCLFHIDDYLPDNRVALCLHFLLHGIHHYLPMDKYRLVMPPTLFVALATPYWKVAHFVFSYNWYAATLVFSGGIFGYICYDLTHYFLHHRNLPYYYKELKKYHLQHHFADYENGFGVTSRFWDKVFGTELPPLAPAKIE
ncbi:ceramide very long chain fatty acid hydroxylase [Trichophyton mentagrophytes]|nr:ceramide very long chain fatty acid hydroxylase [Trichophyton mentagrophytes]